MDEESSLEGGMRFVVTVPGLGMVEYNCVEDTTFDDDGDVVVEKAAAGESTRATVRIAVWNFIAYCCYCCWRDNDNYEAGQSDKQSNRYEWMETNVLVLGCKCTLFILFCQLRPAGKVRQF